jgi:hypothetical protein
MELSELLGVDMSVKSIVLVDDVEGIFFSIFLLYGIYIILERYRYIYIYNRTYKLTYTLYIYIIRVGIKEGTIVHIYDYIVLVDDIECIFFSIFALLLSIPSRIFYFILWLCRFGWFIRSIAY